jgi:hypothetical protein
MMPRVDKAVVPRQLFDAYLQQNEISTRLKLLSTRLLLQERNEARLFVKALRLKVAAYLLLVSAAAIVVGGMLDTIRPTGDSMTRPSPAPTSSSAESSEAALKELLLPDPELMGSPEGDASGLRSLKQAAREQIEEQHRT